MVKSFYNLTGSKAVVSLRENGYFWGLSFGKSNSPTLGGAVLWFLQFWVGSIFLIFGAEMITGCAPRFLQEQHIFDGPVLQKKSIYQGAWKLSKTDPS